MSIRQSSTQPVEVVSPATAEEMDERVRNLDDSARKGLLMVFEQLLMMLESNGCAVCAIDRNGSGQMMVAALGQQAMAASMMGAIAEIHEEMMDTFEGPIQ